MVRDSKIFWSYRLWVTLDIAGAISFVAVYFFVSLLIDVRQIVREGYGVGDYFTFALLGIAFQQYVFSSVQGLSQSIREEQWSGTMETLLSTTMSFKTFLVGEVAFRLLYGSTLLTIALGVGSIFGAKFIVNPSTLLTVAIFTALLVMGHLVIGMLGAAFILRVKQGDAVVWAYSWLSQLLSGIFFPLGLLPDYLRWVGFALPLTYSLDGIRRALMGGATVFDSPLLHFDMLALVVFFLVMIPIALIAFNIAYKASRNDGSLGQY